MNRCPALTVLSCLLIPGPSILPSSLRSQGPQGSLPDSRATITVRDGHVTIPCGHVAVEELWRLAGGIPDEEVRGTIRLATEVRKVPLVVIPVLLEANGWKVGANGKLKRESLAERVEEPEDDGQPPDKAPHTIVLRVQSPSGVAKSLLDLVRSGEEGNTSETRRHDSFRALAVNSTDCLVVRGSLNLVEYAHRIVSLSCTPPPSGPDPVVEVVSVRHVEVEKLTEAIESILELWRMSVEPVSRSPERRVDVSVLPDARTKRLIVASPDAQLVSRIQELVSLIDWAPQPPQGATSAAHRTDREQKAGVTNLPISRHSVFRGKRVDILEGNTPVKEFFRFLADYTGLPLIVAGEPPGGLDAIVTVAAAIHDADATVVEAILEANGWLLEQRTLPGDKEILEVSHTSSPRSPAAIPRRVIRIDPPSSSATSSDGKPSSETRRRRASPK